MSNSRTLIVFKPDSIERGLVGEALSRIERMGHRVVELKTVEVTEERMEAHYANEIGDVDEDFHSRLCDYLVGETVIAGIIEGTDAVESTKKVVGGTEPTKADTGTIRGDFMADTIATSESEGRVVNNLIHASEKGDAEREIGVWFPERDD